MSSAGEGRIPSPILDEAAEWLVRLQDSGCTDDTRQACAIPTWTRRITPWSTAASTTSPTT